MPDAIKRVIISYIVLPPISLTEFVDYCHQTYGCLNIDDPIFSINSHLPTKEFVIYEHNKTKAGIELLANNHFRIKLTHKDQIVFLKLLNLRKTDFCCDMPLQNSFLFYALQDIKKKTHEMACCLHYKKDSWGLAFVKKMFTVQRFHESLYYFLPRHFDVISNDGWDQIKTLCFFTYNSMIINLAMYIVDYQPDTETLMCLTMTLNALPFYETMQKAHVLLIESDSD